MATLHLMVGLPCSGKTTRARQIERERNCLRLTPDEWICTLLGADPDQSVLDAVRDPMEALLWGVAEKVLVTGGEVILDFGFWSRVERNDYRSRARRLGAICVIHYQAASRDDLVSRLRARNTKLPAGCFYIDEARLHGWFELFQPPGEEELVAV
jgi:predicted kinase